MNKPNAPAFRNLNELTTYLSTIEKRMAALEAENQGLRSKLADLDQRQAKTTFKTESDRLPQTSMLSDSFLIRAFAVWGHHCVAQAIIAIPVVICYLVLIFAFIDSLPAQ